VHRAVLRVRGRPLQVVVKVRHPGVVTRLAQDFRLLKPLAAAASRVRSLKGLSRRESLAQFSGTMTAQARPRPPAPAARAHSCFVWPNHRRYVKAVHYPS